MSNEEMRFVRWTCGGILFSIFFPFLFLRYLRDMTIIYFRALMSRSQYAAESANSL